VVSIGQGQGQGFRVTTANASWLTDLFGPNSRTVNIVPDCRTVAGLPVRNSRADHPDDDSINPGWNDQGDEYTGPTFREYED